MDLSGNLTTEEKTQTLGEYFFFLMFYPYILDEWTKFYEIDFYATSHINNLDYFILYLRSFKDDRKQTFYERKLMKTLYSFFCPFAVGRPDEIKASYSSSPRLYIGEDWKENVKEMLEKAPIVLLRVSDTDNFFWEFEQCIINNYLNKSLFWISDLGSYVSFRSKANTRFNISFPPESEVSENCTLFLAGNVFTVCPLGKKKSRKLFCKNTMNHLGQI